MIHNCTNFIANKSFYLLFKAITIADVSEEQGKKAVEDLEKDFGTDKIIFVKVDVCSKKQLEGRHNVFVFILQYC